MTLSELLDIFKDKRDLLEENQRLRNKVADLSLDVAYYKHKMGELNKALSEQKKEHLRRIEWLELTAQ